MIAAAGVLSNMHTFIVGERPVGLTGNDDPCRRTAISDYLTHNSFQRELKIHLGLLDSSIDRCSRLKSST